MFNVHVFHRRFPALATAVFASLALAFVAIAGSTCSFLNVEASDGRFVEFTSGVEQEAVTAASFGVLCETYYFDSDGDTMWNISKVFLYVSLALGGLAAALAWIITWCIPPDLRLWRFLSVTSALTAVLNIPIFLLFEADPCTIDNSRQKCVLSFGSFLLMSGTVSSIAVVLLTQCIDPPKWGTELDAWKVDKREKEQSERLSRGVVPSDEYAGSEYKDPPPPDADAPQAVATAGVMAGFQRWRQRQKWARSSSLTQNVTTPSSRDDEEAVPFAGAGSYYANSSNSRLLLKVPEGKRDEQESMVSFGDLDDYVKMVEEGNLNRTMSTGSLDDTTEKSSRAEDTYAEVSSDAPLLLLSQDESESKTLSTATNDGIDKFSDEPQFYSEMKAPPSVKEERGLLENGDSDSLEDVDVARQSKLSRGIRSLTSRVIRDTNRRTTKSGRMYTMMDDDDASGISSPPRPEDGEAGTGRDRDSVTDDESSSRNRNASDRDHLHHQTLLFDWNALHAAANAGILLAREESQSDPESSDEDEPVQVTYTSDDTFGPGSSSSLGNLPDDEADDNSAFSASSISDISDKEEDENLVLGDGIAARKDRKRSTRRSPRKMVRDYSSANSISSYTSVLDMTIDEETDLELKEFESSDDEKEKSGYKSAPEALGADRKLLKPYAFIQSESLPTSGERGYIVPKTEHFDSSQSVDSSRDPGLVTPDTSTSQTMMGTPSDLSDERNRSAYHSDGSIGRDRKLAGADDEEEEASKLCFRRSRSMSLPRRKKGASVHPLMTPPLSPTSHGDAKSLPWREERLYKGGIHSSSTHIVSDSETSDEMYMSEASAKSSMSRRARKARIRRLQSESSTQRQRSRTLDPPKNRRRYDRQPAYQAPESHNATMHRLLFGSDGREESSL